MKHKAIRIDNLMYKGCEPHWKCTLCGDVVPFHCYTKEEFENMCCGCHKPNCADCTRAPQRMGLEMRAANSNYEDIIQCGDAFQVRKEDWRLEQ